MSPMRPWQNALAIVAGFLVAGALLPWSLRLACALGAIGIVVLLAVFRLRAHSRDLMQARTSNVYARLEKMRSDRRERFGRNNPRPPGR